MSSNGGAERRPPARVCFFGTYRREHSATRLLADACRTAGIDVIECHRPLWENTRHKHAKYFGVRSALGLLVQYALNALVLAYRQRRLGDIPLYVIGFGGQLDCLLLHLLLRRQRRPIVLVPLVTLSETLIDDRSVFQPGSVRSRWAAWLDRRSLSLATRVVMDTEAHRRYVTDTFAMDPEKISAWHLGADTGVFVAAPLPSGTSPLRVLFYGTFLPLHGTRTVLEAAALLKHRADIEFVLLGDGPERAASLAFARDAGLVQVRFLDWVAYETLGSIVASAHICLGIFGTSNKVQMVIPNKVYQAAATGRPIITADTPAVREVFSHDETAWLVPAGDPAALAAAVETLASDQPRRERLARGAATLMEERFAPAVQGRKLAAIFAETIAVS